MFKLCKYLKVFSFTTSYRYLLQQIIILFLSKQQLCLKVAIVFEEFEDDVNKIMKFVRLFLCLKQQNAFE